MGAAIGYPGAFGFFAATGKILVVMDAIHAGFKIAITIRAHAILLLNIQRKSGPTIVTLPHLYNAL